MTETPYERRLKSFLYAINGLREIARSQPNARIHLSAAALALFLGSVLGLSSAEWVMLVMVIALVLAAEAFNTALEHLTDLVSPEFHPLAGKAKDAAAAGVLLTAAGAAVSGAILFLPKLFALF